MPLRARPVRASEHPRQKSASGSVSAEVRWLSISRAAAVGQPEAQLDLAADAGTPAFVTALTASYPQLEKLLPRCALAINGEYVEDASASLCDGDEVAVLPPMSGG